MTSEENVLTIRAATSRSQVAQALVIGLALSLWLAFATIKLFYLFPVALFCTVGVGWLLSSWFSAVSPAALIVASIIPLGTLVYGSVWAFERPLGLGIIGIAMAHLIAFSCAVVIPGLYKKRDLEELERKAAPHPDERL